MHIVIKFLTTSKFYITSKNQRPVTSPSGKVGGARLTRFMVITLSKCKKKLRYPAAIVCNTHDSDRPGEHWVAMYVDAERRGDYFDSYGLQLQHVGFVDFMTEHCSTWSTNERTLQSPLSTVCGQYCVAFLMFRCRDASMNAFTRLFTTDLVANDCRVFDWVAAVNKK